MKQEKKLTIQLLSDTHTKNIQDIQVSDEADFIIHCGDLSNTFNLERFIDFDSLMLYKEKDYLIVLGNHDYYSKTRKEVLSILEEFRIPVLTADRPYTPYNHKGVTFIGDTLFSNIPPHKEFLFQKNIHDFKYIRKWNVEKHNKAFRKQYNEIIDCYNKMDKDTTPVFVTHFPPSYACLTDKFRGNPLNDYFLNELPILRELPKSYWFSGHTHITGKFEAYNTEIHLNAHGYGTENPEYKDIYLVDIY